MSQGPDHNDLVSCIENFAPYSKRNQKPFKGLKRVKQYLMCFFKDKDNAKNGTERGRSRCGRAVRSQGNS